MTRPSEATLGIEVALESSLTSLSEPRIPPQGLEEHTLILTWTQRRNMFLLFSGFQRPQVPNRNFMPRISNSDGPSRLCPRRNQLGSKTRVYMTCCFYCFVPSSLRAAPACSSVKGAFQGWEDSRERLTCAQGAQGTWRPLWAV